MSDRARLAAYKAFRRTCEGAYSNLLGKEEDLSELDRAFAESIALGTLERKLTLEYIAAPYIKKDTDEATLYLLLTGLYQVFYMDRVPDSAACDETVRIAAGLFGRGKAGFVNAVMRSAVRAKAQRLRAVGEAGGHIAASMNRSLYEMLKLQYPEKIDAICGSLFGKADVYLRVNTLVSLPEEVAILTGGEVAGEKTVLCREARGAVKNIDSGKYFIQGAGSQRAVEWLGAESGETIIDVCAAPGGKCLGAAIDMRNEGKIYAFDLHEKKLSLIKNAAAKLGINIIETAVNDARNAKSEFLGKADGVICDVPCSGTGEMRSKPEIKYKDPRAFEGLYKTQREIINAAAKYLKQGGRMIYSTCSINRYENEETVARFIAENPGFSLVREQLSLPCGADGEGFYTAEIKREKAL